MRETQISAIVAESDKARRMFNAVRAFKGGTCPLVRLNPHHAAHEPGFLHFTFLAGKTGFENYKGKILLDPYTSGFSSPAQRQQLTGLHLHTYRLELSPEIDVQIIASWLPGKLKNSFVFSYPK
jgi:hypothetical protein